MLALQGEVRRSPSGEPGESNPRLCRDRLHTRSASMWARPPTTYLARHATYSEESAAMTPARRIGPSRPTNGPSGAFTPEPTVADELRERDQLYRRTLRLAAATGIDKTLVDSPLVPRAPRKPNRVVHRSSRAVTGRYVNGKRVYDQPVVVKGDRYVPETATVRSGFDWSADS